VEELAGKRSAPNPDRIAYRWGTEDGHPCCTRELRERRLHAP
jgi:hypothetical protein